MKCYYVQWKPFPKYEGYVFAKTRGKAKQVSMEQLHSAGWTDAKFIEQKATREPELDKYFIEGNKIFDYGQVLSGGR